MMQINSLTLSFDSRDLTQINSIAHIDITSTFLYKGLNIVFRGIISSAWMQSFAYKDSLLSGTHGYHQTMRFLLCDALPGPYVQLLLVAAC